MSRLLRKLLKMRHRYCSPADVGNNVKFLWLPCNLDLSYLVQTLIMVCKFQSGLCHLRWFHFHGVLDQVLGIKSVSPLPYNQGSLYLVHILMMEGMCRPICWLQYMSIFHDLDNLGSPYLVYTLIIEWVQFHGTLI